MANFIKQCLFCVLGIYFLLGCSLDVKFSSIPSQDSPPLTVQISTANNSLNSLSSFPVDLIFSSDVSNLTESYIQVTGGTLVPGSLVGSGKSYSMSIAPSGEGVVQISFPEQNILTVGSPDSKKTNSSSISVSIDTTAPTVQVTTSVVSPTPLTSIPVTVTFTEPVSGLETSDFLISGGGAAITSITGSGSVYQINILPVLAATIYIELPIGAVQDAAGNASFASNELEIDYQTAPTDALGVSIAGPTPSLGSVATDFVWTVNYTGAWIVDLSAVTLLGTDNAGCSVVISGTGKSSRTVTMSGCTGNGTLGFAIPTGSARDLDGNLSEAQVSGYATVSNVPVSLSIASPSPTTGSNATVFVWTLNYSGASSVSLVPGDITLHGLSVGCSVSVTGSDLLSRQVHVTGCTGYGPISISVAAGTALSNAGSLAPAVPTSKEVRLNKYLSASFSLASSVALKGSSDSSQSFVVQLNSPAAVDVSVSYQLTTYTTAIQPDDYNLISGTIVIPAGQTTGNINYIFNDSTVMGSRIIQPALTKVFAGDFIGAIGTLQIHRRIAYDNSDLAKTFATVSVGGDHFCGINKVGDLMCAGSNAYGELGLPGVSYLEIPTVVDASVKYIYVSAGNRITCAITENYVLKCWGANSTGQLGDGTNVAKNAPVIIDGGTQYVKVSTLGYHTCGVTIDAQLKCWGNNSFGQVGNGTITATYLPYEIDSTFSYSEVGVGSEHSCGLLVDGTLKCWGRNYNAQLGDGHNSSERRTPFEINPGVKYAELAVGNFHNCAITTGGALKCWGDNQSYQTINLAYSPATVDNGVSYSKVSTGSQHSCGVTTTGVIKCWGGNTYGQIGNGSYSSVYSPTAIEVGTSYAQIKSGAYYNCGITSEGVLKCWGNNLGNGIVATSVSQPIPIDSASLYKSLNLGSNATCGLLTTNQAKCWGNNSSGQIGDGGGSKYFPTEVQGKFKVISLGTAHGCGITEEDTLKCWGTGEYGRLGNGGTSNSSVPINIEYGTLYKYISVGSMHSCGITSEGVLKCWGRNNFGQLGDNSIVDKSSPTIIDVGTTYSFVDSGAFSTCAITSSGVLKCWGYNSRGQLGDGTTVDKRYPVVADSGVSYRQVSIEEEHACGITAENDLKCWGWNIYGQLGDTTTNNQTMPTLIESGIKYRDIAAGVRHSCGITEAGVLKCWGHNSVAQLGDGTVTSRNIPTVVDGGIKYLSVDAEAIQTCAVTESNKLKCWGSNSYGQLGLGIMLGYPSPIAF